MPAPLVSPPARPARRNLVATVADELRAAIADSSFRPGDRLPSESKLTERFSVSRTVIREAIANLRADGLVEARQGAGVFVLEPAEQAARPFQVADPQKISSIIEMLELRTGVEIEAAGLAAQRRSPAQEEAILNCNSQLVQRATEREPTTEADFEFHLAIADASNNPRFREFLEVMGSGLIPRSALQQGPREAASGDYLGKIVAEHRAIAEAISNGDADEAREAMRQHLTRSQQRYRQMIVSSLARTTTD
jgi:GntR family transcriptional repressor for pyruvate dehydrogenase complex